MDLEEVTVLYVATKNTPGLNNLTKSLSKFGYAHKRVGAGLKWGGWRHRMSLYLQICKEFSPVSVLVLIDADDVLPAKFPRNILASFLSFGCDILVSTESECVPSTCHEVNNYWRLHSDVLSPRKYVCCGGMMGRAGALAVLWQALLDSGHSDDQYALGEYINKNPKKVILDHNNAIFYNPQVPFRKKNPIFVFGEDGTVMTVKQGNYNCHPYFIHFQGNFLSSAISRVLVDNPANDRHLYDELAQNLIGDSAMPYFCDSAHGRLIVRSIFWGVLTIALVSSVVALVIRKRAKAL